MSIQVCEDYESIPDSSQLVRPKPKTSYKKIGGILCGYLPNQVCSQLISLNFYFSQFSVFKFLYNFHVSSFFFHFSFQSFFIFHFLFFLTTKCFFICNYCQLQPDVRVSPFLNKYFSNANFTTDLTNVCFEFLVWLTQLSVSYLGVWII